VKRRTSQLQRNNEESAAEIISLRCEEKLQVLREITKAYNIQATHLLHRFRNTTRGISADWSMKELQRKATRAEF